MESASFAYTITDPAAPADELRLEQTVFAYGGEDAALVFAETQAHLENNLRDSGLTFAEVAPPS